MATVSVSGECRGQSVTQHGFVQSGPHRSGYYNPHGVRHSENPQLSSSIDESQVRQQRMVSTYRDSER